MKYIGSGLWGLAAAYLEVSGAGQVSVLFGCIGIAIAIFGSNKSLVTINNSVKDTE